MTVGVMTCVAAVAAMCPGHDVAAGERDLAHERMPDERLTRLGVAVDDVEQPVGQRLPASRRTTAVTASGANGDGFTTIALPATSAGATLSIDRMIGAFHGVTAATTPNGARRTSRRPSSSSISCVGQHALGVVARPSAATRPAKPSSPRRPGSGLPSSRASVCRGQVEDSGVEGVGSGAHARAPLGER